MSGLNLATWMAPHLARVEAALSAHIQAQSPAALGEAMRYAVLDGGKRLRPLLVLATAEAVGTASDSPAALNAACAIALENFCCGTKCASGLGHVIHEQDIAAFYFTDNVHRLDLRRADAVFGYDSEIGT